ncbi:MAG: hypothetical protein K0U36_00910 [Alphaproteobacteria bacterium]|nr:hypothetical protein [Alphaproteobacteria bacterium]
MTLPPRDDWDTYFVRMLYCIVARSIDPRTNTAALIVSPDHSVLATGYNALPRGLDEKIVARLQQPAKKDYIEHAERNAIYEAARRGQALQGAFMYTMFLPCTACMRAIIQCGIRRLTIHANHIGNKDYATTPRHAATLEMMREVGIELHEWHGTITLPQIRYDDAVEDGTGRVILPTSDRPS